MKNILLDDQIVHLRNDLHKVITEDGVASTNAIHLSCLLDQQIMMYYRENRIEKSK